MTASIHKIAETAAFVKYVLTKSLPDGQDVTQGQFLSEVKLVSNQSFPS